MASLLGPEFENFLFAPIGEDRNGMLLSVLSALARADVDPWQEAARLARLPKETATQSLASLIAKLSGELATHLDPGTIAARLIALLPRLVSYDVSSHEPPGIGAVTNSRHLIHLTLIFVVIVSGALALIANRQLPAGVVDADASTSSAVIPQTYGQ